MRKTKRSSPESRRRGAKAGVHKLLVWPPPSSPSSDSSSPDKITPRIKATREIESEGAFSGVLNLVMQTKPRGEEEEQKEKTVKCDYGDKGGK